MPSIDMPPIDLARSTLKVIDNPRSSIQSAEVPGRLTHIDVMRYHVMEVMLEDNLQCSDCEGTSLVYHYR